MSALLACIAVVSLFAACQEENFGGEDGMNFELLFDCMWVPDSRGHIPSTDEIPPVALDPAYPVYFNNEGTKLEVLHHSGDNYTPYMTYDALVNRATKVITLSSEGRKTYVAHITILSPNHLSVYFGEDEDNHVVYNREELPPEISLR